VKKRQSLLHGLKPDQIRMLLWFADEEEARENDTDNRGKYKITTISLREKVMITHITNVIEGRKNKRIEEIILRIIEPHRWAVNMTLLKNKWKVNKKQYYNRIVGYC